MRVISYQSLYEEKIIKVHYIYAYNIFIIQWGDIYIFETKILPPTPCSISVECNIFENRHYANIKIYNKQGSEFESSIINILIDKD